MNVRDALIRLANGEDLESLKLEIYEDSLNYNKAVPVSNTSWFTNGRCIQSILLSEIQINT